MLYQHDLPAEMADHFLKTDILAVDTETMGLNGRRDRLCLVQLYDGDGTYAAVQLFPRTHEGAPAPENLQAVLNGQQLKLAHHARFDMRMIWHGLNVMMTNVYCTRLGNKVARTAAASHSLKDVVKDLCGVDLPKENQNSDWGAETLTNAQLTYAMTDVLHLHKIYEKQAAIAEREGRTWIMATLQAGLYPIVVADITEFSTDDKNVYDR